MAEVMSDNLDADVFDPNADRLREECGVFGIYGHPDAAAITALGLHALQHRGQEAAGIVTYDGKRFHSERRLGLVGDTFSRRDVIDPLPRHMAVGHARPSPTHKKNTAARPTPLAFRPRGRGESGGPPLPPGDPGALDITGARSGGDGERGEFVFFAGGGREAQNPFPPMPPRPCIFEYIY